METTLLHSTFRLTSFPSLTHSSRFKRLTSLRFKPFSLSFSLRHRPVTCFAKAHNHHHHHHDHHHHHHQDHQHHHHHHHENCNELSEPQKAVIKFAEATRWLDLANFLREHLQLCCSATALFLAAAACPYLLPKPAVKPLQNAFIFLAFPLVGVNISFPFFVFFS